MPHEEKDSIGDDAAGSSEVNPILRAFAEFGTTGELSVVMEEFIGEHCHEFSDAELGGENRLEWTDSHNE